MDKVIHKHTINSPGGLHILQMSVDAVPISVDIQAGRIVVWEKHPETVRERRPVEFALVFTGETFNDYWWRFLGTVQLGAFVCHVHWRRGGAQ